MTDLELNSRIDKQRMDLIEMIVTSVGGLSLSDLHRASVIMKTIQEVAGENHNSRTLSDNVDAGRADKVVGIVSMLADMDDKQVSTIHAAIAHMLSPAGREVYGIGNYRRSDLLLWSLSLWPKLIDGESCYASYIVLNRAYNRQ